MDTYLFGNAEVDGNPELDQLQATARETTSRWMGAGPALVAAGHADTFFGGENPNAALNVAQSCTGVPRRSSAEITRLCDQTYLVRPFAMKCDPPTIACSECVTTGAVALIGTPDFQWDNHCDRCRAHDTLLTPTVLPLGHVTVSAHVCRRCADEDQDHALKRAEHVVQLTGNRDIKQSNYQDQKEEEVSRGVAVPFERKFWAPGSHCRADWSR
jgi:hypothetical protein